MVVSNIFISSLFGEDFHFDKYFSKGLKPPSRKTNMTMEKTTMNEDISPEMQMVFFFQCHVSFQGGCQKMAGTWWEDVLENF